MIPQVQTKKGANKRTGGPKASISDSASSDNEKTEDESSSQITKSDKNLACSIKTVEKKSKSKPPLANSIK